MHLDTCHERLELGRILGNETSQRGELLGGIVIVGIAITADLL